MSSETSPQELLSKTIVSSVETLMDIVCELKDSSKKGLFLANMIVGISSALIYHLARACGQDPQEVKKDILNSISLSVDSTIELNEGRPAGDSIH